MASTYLFIDGGYLSKAMTSSMVRFFGEGVDWAFDLSAMKRHLDCEKAFFYDCIDEDQPETDGRKEFLEHVDRLEGFHVRRGTLSKGRRRSQKEVDVQLAVDLLSHVHRKNARRVVLVTGDLDFRPVVEAAVAAGAYVVLLYDRGSIAKPLTNAADLSMEMTLQTYVDWSTLRKQKLKQLPKPLDWTSGSIYDHMPTRHVAQGPDGPVLIRRTSDWLLSFHVPLRESGATHLDRSGYHYCESLETLKHFASVELGTDLQWSDAA